ncbi:RING-H2 finger protein ATL78 [Morus notabilis]|uniref:RING-type E3 ubiquitin transferase n=1 Tax=Morus notabilis TaxID=981085 RepID=W9QSY6_9ROSA|nr:RING-H2 finger protein ATL78 [Morus notabilis]EXB53534.1 RING-H2 finger protein ATL78 [Morus notabilis]
MAATSFYSRRLILHSPLTTAAPPSPVAAAGHSSPSSSSSSEQYPGDSSFDANVVMVLSVLLCALICSLGLNSIIRCALRCSTFVSASGSSSESGSDSRSAQSAAANTGVKKKALKTFPTVSFSSDLNLPGLDSECAICLSDFAAGDSLRLLPKCNHGFHARCIDKWLNSHSSCPKCRHNLLETCQKIVGAASSSEQFPAVQDPSAVVLAVSPLEPEGPIRSYRGNS